VPLLPSNLRRTTQPSGPFGQLGRVARRVVRIFFLSLVNQASKQTSERPQVDPPEVAS